MRLAHNFYEEEIMKTIRRPITQICLLILSLIGAGIAIYLTTVHYENVPLICSASGVVDCARVLSSSYSVVPSTTVPITVPGLAWCAISAILAIIGLRFQLVPHWLHIAQFVLSLAGILAVLYLVYVEIVRLHTICAWCTGLHVVILVMFLITLVQLQATQTDLEVESESEQSKVTTTSR
jgi:uncharacterized membrane protein